MSTELKAENWPEENHGYGPIAKRTVVMAMCEDFGLSREKFAHRFGLSEATLKRWENVEYNDSDLMVIRLIESFPDVATQLAKMKRARDREFAEE